MNSIRGRLSLWLTSSFMLLAVIGGLFVYNHVHAAMLRQFDAGLSVRARALASLLRVDHNGVLALDFHISRCPSFFMQIVPNIFSPFCRTAAFL